MSELEKFAADVERMLMLQCDAERFRGDMDRQRAYQRSRAAMVERVKAILHPPQTQRSILFGEDDIVIP